MNTAKQLVKESIKQYQVILSRTSDLEQQLQQLNSELLTETATWLTTAMKSASETDTRITEAFLSNTALGNTPLFEQRTTLIEQVSLKIGSLSIKLNAIMAVHQSELKKIKQGRQTMGGYGQEKRKTGRLINTSN